MNWVKFTTWNPALRVATIDPMTCPKCRAEMEEGFPVDETSRSRLVGTWVAGSPVKSFWLGVKIGDRRRLEIQMFRCTQCGYLENYAK